MWARKLKTESKYMWNAGSNFSKCKSTEDGNFTLQMKLEVKVYLHMP
jgi:hypothetical protein